MSWCYQLLTLITLELTLREIWIVDEDLEHLWITDEVEPQQLIGIPKARSQRLEFSPVSLLARPRVTSV